MKIVASLALASLIVSAAHAAAQYSSNSGLSSATPGHSGIGQAVQRLDVGRLTLLAGPQLTSAHPGFGQTGPIPPLDSTNPPAFLHKYTEPVFESVTTGDNVRRVILRVTPPAPVKEFTAPAAATPASLQFGQRLPAPPSAPTARGQPSPVTIPLPPPAATP